MAELLTNIREIAGLVGFLFGFGGGFLAASIKIKVQKQSVKNGTAFQAGGDININRG